ncbi:MAG: hypothetical protein COX79_04495, partial [Candidatus Levybacteria bacterium CG_4_10_14_0_2_um_filter_36_16]
MRNAKKILAGGLSAGYAGGSRIEDVARGGFHLKSSHIKTSDGIYHDEWAAHRAGGGQEIVSVEDKIYTRVYAGGTISLEKLKQLGVEESEVGDYLKRKLTELGDKTRFDEDCSPEPDGEWQYTYKVMNREDDIPLIVGYEHLLFQD